MKHQKLIPFILAFFICACNIALAANTKKDLIEKNKSLAEIQNRIDKKKDEKKKYLEEEKKISKELDSLAKELSKILQQGEKIRRDIIKAEENLMLSEKELKTSKCEKNRWADNINIEINAWQRESRTNRVLFEDFVNEKLRIQAISQKRNLFESASDRELTCQIALYKWQNAQKDLKNLKIQQEKTQDKKSLIQNQKKILLSTTMGRRLSADKEIIELTESAKAMKELIAKLEAEKQKRITDKKTYVKYQPKRKKLLWPIKGTIVAKYGKNKHPEFDTFIISNGIKIYSKRGGEVRASAKGDVLFTGEFRTYGLVIIIDNGGSVYTVYGNLGAINVQENYKVKEGEVIGQLSAADNPILYFEVRYKGQPDDPLLWLSK